MEKEIKYALRCAQVLTAVLTIWAFYLQDGWLFLLFGLGGLVIMAILSTLRDNLLEAKNLLNPKRIADALAFCANERCGNKTDFINRHGKELYEHFITKGFLHEPFNKVDVWELTKLGLRAHVQMKAD